jgi:hypothetical protein
MCSFDEAIPGSFYGTEMTQIDEAGRICMVDYDPLLPVHTAWDLGWTDDTAIWFYQLHRMELRFIDYYAASGQTIAHFAKVLQDRRSRLNQPYTYGKHYLPWDARPATLASGGRSILEQLAGFVGVGNIEIVPNLGDEDQVQATRAILSRVWFDRERCADGINCLRSFHREWDDDRKIFKRTYKHDWCLAAGTLVQTPSGWRPVEELTIHNEVLTPSGPRRILRSGIVRETNEWVTIKGIRCTPEHRFFTNRGLVEAGELSSLDILWTRDSWGLSILAFLSAIFRLGLKAATISATPEAKTKTKDIQSSCIGWSMRLCTAQFRKALKSITLTKILSTIIPPILRRSLAFSTAGTINQNNDILAFAKCAEKSSVAIKSLVLSAACLAKKQTTLDASASVDYAPAYNLTVDVDECYFVRGNDGAAYLVSNSSHGAKAFGYAAVSYKQKNPEMKTTVFRNPTWDEVMSAQDNRSYETRIG